MMKKLLFFGISLVFVISLALVCQKSAIAADPQPIKLVYSSFFSERAMQEQVDKWFMAEVEKRTNGRVKFTMYFAGEVTKSMESLPHLRTGAVDIANPAPGFFPDELPLAGLTNATRIGRDFLKTLDAGYKFHLYDKEVTKYLDEEARKQNFKWLYVHAVPNYLLLTKKPVYKLSDLKGLRVRTFGVYEPKHYARFGAISANILPAEWYEALARGTVDGIPMSCDLTLDFKLQEVAKYMSFDDGTLVVRPFLINLDTWNKKLTPEVRKLMEGMREEVYQYQRKFFSKMRDEAYTAIKEAGVKFIQVDPKEQEEISNDWIKVTIDEWLPGLEKKGYKNEAPLLLNRWLELNTGKGLDFWKKHFSK